MLDHIRVFGQLFRFGIRETERLESVLHFWVTPFLAFFCHGIIGNETTIFTVFGNVPVVVKFCARQTIIDLNIQVRTSDLAIAFATYAARYVTDRIISDDEFAGTDLAAVSFGVGVEYAAGLNDAL